MTRASLLPAALAVLSWGAGAIFDKLALSQMPPRAVFVARLYLMFVLLLVPMVLAWEETRLAVWRADRRVVAYLAGSVVFTLGGLYAYYHALAGSQATRVVPLCATYPLIAYLLTMAFLKEPFTASGFAGTLLVAGGTYLLARP